VIIAHFLQARVRHQQRRGGKARSRRLASNFRFAAGSTGTFQLSNTLKPICKMLLVKIKNKQALARTQNKGHKPR